MRFINKYNSVKFGVLQEARKLYITFKIFPGKDYHPRKIIWAWELWKIWAKKTNNHSQIMALVLIKSDFAGFFVQIYSQNHEAIITHPFGNGVRNKT